MQATVEVTKALLEDLLPLPEGTKIESVSAEKGSMAVKFLVDHPSIKEGDKVMRVNITTDGYGKVVKSEFESVERGN